MSREEAVFDLLVHSNPIPDMEDLDLVRAAAPDYISTLERRSSAMVNVDTRSKTQRGNRGVPGWSWAAVLVVVLIGVAAVAISQRGEGSDPVAAPTAEEIAETFVVGIRDLDPDAVEGLVTDEAAVTYLAAFGYDETRPGSIRGLWEWGAIYGQTYTFEEGCRETNMLGNPPAAPDTTRPFFTCDYQLENDWTRALGQPPMSGRFRMEVFDGEIVWLVDDYPADEWPWGDVVDWVQANHLEDFTTMFLDPPSSAKLTPESMALWEEYTPEIARSLSG